MFFDERITSARLAKELIRYLNQMWQPLPQNAIFVWANEALPGLQEIVVHPATGLASMQLYLKWPQFGIILIQGALGEPQATSYMNACRANPDWLDGFGVNSFVRSQSLIVDQRAEALGLTGGFYLTIAGHSLGGAIGLDAMRRFRQRGIPALTQCVTFGAPRGGPGVYADRFKDTSICRWMAADDPVPCLPPRTGQNRLYDFLLSATERANENRYCQPEGGVLVDASGNTSSADVPSFSSLDFNLNLAAWLVALEFDLASPHSTSSYLTRLTFAEAKLPPANPSANTSHRVERANASTPAEAREAARRTEAQMREMMREGLSPVVRIPKPKAFTAQREGPVWIVLLRGSVFAIAPTRRRARRIANIGNQWLTKIQVVARMDSGALLGAFESYLTDAQDEHGGFKPVMKS